MNKKIEQAKVLYRSVVEANTKLLSTRKVLVALPKHKEKKYHQVLANALAGKKNADNAFQVHIKKLNPDEFTELHQAVYL